MFWALTLLLSFIGIFVFLVLAVISLISNVREKRIAAQYFVISGLCVAVVCISILNIGKSQMEKVMRESKVASATSMIKDIEEPKKVSVNTVSEKQKKAEEKASQVKAQQDADAKKRFEEAAKRNAKRAETERLIKQAFDKYMYVNFKYYGETSWYSSVSATGCVVDKQGKTFIIQSKSKPNDEKAKHFLEAALGFFNSKTTKSQFLVNKVILIDNQSTILKEVDTVNW